MGDHADRLTIAVIQVCHTVTYICFGCNVLPPRFSEIFFCCIGTSKTILTCLPMIE